MNELLSAYNNRKVALFLGAGISKSCGLPDWRELSASIIAQTWPAKSAYDIANGAIQYYLRDADPLNSMRQARRELGENFNSVVRECLYNNPYTISTTLNSIISLSKINRICCFNYDDLLEEAFFKSGHEVCTIIEGEAIRRDDAIIQIFHPHGILPHLPILERTYKIEEMKIVLSEDDYHNLYTIPYSWSNIIQIDLLLNYSILFVGMSLTDPNTRRLLDVCKRMKVNHKHYAILKNPRYHPEATGWEGMAYSGIDQFVEKALLDLGIQPIWFNEYSDIPGLLQM